MTSGQFAILAVAMAVIGLAIGGVASWFVLRRKASPQTPPTTLDDERRDATRAEATAGSVASDPGAGEAHAQALAYERAKAAAMNRKEKAQALLDLARHGAYSGDPDSEDED